MEDQSAGTVAGVLRGHLSRALFEGGMYCRADDRAEPVIQVSPPLICGQPEFDEITAVLRRPDPRRAPALTATRGLCPRHGAAIGARAA